MVPRVRSKTKKHNNFKEQFPMFRIENRKGRAGRGPRSSLRAQIWPRRRWETLAAGGSTRRMKLQWIRGWHQIALPCINLQDGVKQVDQTMCPQLLSTLPTLSLIPVSEQQLSQALHLPLLANPFLRHKEGDSPNSSRAAERLSQDRTTHYITENSITRKRRRSKEITLNPLLLKNTNSNNELPKLASCWSLPISKAMVRIKKNNSLKSKLFYKNVNKVKVNH